MFDGEEKKRHAVRHMRSSQMEKRKGERERDVSRLA